MIILLSKLRGLKKAIKYCSSIPEETRTLCRMAFSRNWPVIVKKRLNNINYVQQKSAKSHPFVVHVDRCGISIAICQKTESRTRSI